MLFGMRQTVGGGASASDTTAVVAPRPAISGVPVRVPRCSILLCAHPLDLPIALRIGRGTLRKMRQNLGWAIGYNTIALPIAAGVFEPAFGLVLRPEIAALSMSGSSLIVAVNALMLKRLQLPSPPQEQPAPRPAPEPIPTSPRR